MTDEAEEVKPSRLDRRAKNAPTTGQRREARFLAAGRDRNALGQRGGPDWALQLLRQRQKARLARAARRVSRHA